MDNNSCFEIAKELMPGGVNSPVRAFKSVGGTPKFIERAKGPYLFDVEGKQYTDYVGSFGPAILGHAHPDVITAITKQAQKGTSFGAPTQAETQLAARIIKQMDAIEMIRFVNSGTEACMSAIRLARAYTKRDYIIKFSGCYHGHADYLLADAGSGLATAKISHSPGVPEAFSKYTLNDPQALTTCLEHYSDQIGAIIFEPICGNMNFIRPQQDFIAALNNAQSNYDCLLICDEVMTGFRVAACGAQSLFGIKPDLTILGKVIGGGLPVGAFGGKKEIMEHLAPEGSVYQAGTLSGNPLAMAAGLTTLEIILKDKDFYQKLEQKTQYLMDQLTIIMHQKDLPFSAVVQGGMFGFAFIDAPPENFTDISKADQTCFNAFFQHMLHHGHYFAPSMFEAGFISCAHTMQDIDQTLYVAQSFDYSH